jgi:hypothetical protein
VAGVVPVDIQTLEVANDGPVGATSKPNPAKSAWRRNMSRHQPRRRRTLHAGLIWCACDIDGSSYTPFWFHLNEDPDLLVEPGVTSVPPDMDDWFGLNLDPAGEHPDALPQGEVVEVTGMFDHPAAASCTRTEMDGEPLPSQGCRLEFAVTRLVVRP